MADNVNDPSELIRVIMTSGEYAGYELAFWESAEIGRGLDHCASSFSLAIGRGKLRDQGIERFPVRDGDGLQVLIGDDAVITGAIDKVKKSRTAEQHGVNIQGRSVTADLIDCSATNSPGQWCNADSARIFADLTHDFGIPVFIAPQGRGTVANFEIEQGDTVFEAMEKLARLRGLIIHDSPAGVVQVVRPGARRALTTLRHRDGADGRPDPDNNVLESDFIADMTKRFSQVMVKGQGEGGISKAGAMGEARDNGVPRHRPLIVKAEGQADSAFCQRRAQWEVARRAGKATQLILTVRGWRQIENGPLWDIDQVVAVEDDSAELYRDMLIIEAKWSMDRNGRRTILTLEPPEAWEPQPFIGKEVGGGGGKWTHAASYSKYQHAPAAQSGGKP